MAFQLTSTAFADGARIPAKYTCEGEDISPPLAWSGAPVGTRSFALLCDDPDAPAGTWHHWAMFDLPADTTQLAEAYPPETGDTTTRQAINDFERPGYGGPCPPPGHGTHHYHFRLLALDVAQLNFEEQPHCTEVKAVARSHVLDEALLTGTYAR